MGVNENDEKMIVRTTRVEGYEHGRRKNEKYFSNLGILRGIPWMSWTLVIFITSSPLSTMGSDITEQAICDLDDTGFYHQVYCRASTENLAAALTCFQNGREMYRIQHRRVTSNGWLSIQTSYRLPKVRSFFCCLHRVGSVVNAATCDDFEWSPPVPISDNAERATCFMGRGANFHPLRCEASTTNLALSELSCYQNDRKVNVLQYQRMIVNNHLSIEATYRLSKTASFYCCLHGASSVVSAATCDDFAWSPPIRIPSTSPSSPHQVTCFIENFSGDISEVHCRASTTHLESTLACYQNGREMTTVLRSATTINWWRSVHATFSLPSKTPFYCCMREDTSTVSNVCNDFEWPPPTVIRSTVSRPVDEVSDTSKPVTIRPVNEDSDTSKPVTIRPADEVSDTSKPVTIRPVDEISDTSEPVTIRPVDEGSDTSEPVTIRPVNKDSYTSKPVTIRPVDEVSDISELVIRPVNEDREVSNIIPTDPILEIPVMLAAATEFIDEYSGTCTSFSPQFWNCLCLSMYTLIFVMIY